MFTIILFVLSWIVKNIALLIGILESIIKAITGIITLTPTKRDDKLLPVIDKIFSTIKKYLYMMADFMSGKEKYIEK
jgi:DNA-binding ferritin-like protein